MRNHGSKLGWIGILGTCLIGHLTAQQGHAEPLDLTNVHPRRIEVRFETSPADEPGSLDQEWSNLRAAYLEPGSTQSQVQIRIPAAEVEEQLRSEGTDAIAGTFSDFVWTLDTATGHVLAAGLSGRVREPIRIGLIRSSAQVEIRVEMATTAEQSAGFEPDAALMGVRTNRFCAPESLDPGCVGVAPIRFDPARGYVNAVGSLRAKSAFVEIRAFSPLGEVEFLEISRGGTESVVSGTSQTEALCSDAFTSPCRGHLGGES